MVILIGIAFLIILIIGHEFGHFFAAKAFNMRVDEFGFGFPPRLFSRKKGETRYSFNLLPFGGFVRIHGEHGDGSELEEPERSFTRQSAARRAVVIVAGALMNFIIGWIAFSAVFAIGLPNQVFIESVVPGSPAELAGLEAGQPIEGYPSTAEFIEFVEANRGEEILINGTALTPRENPPEGEGALGVVVTDAGIPRQSIARSVWSGLASAVELTWLIALAFLGFIADILGGNFGVVDQVTGPVGVFGILGDTSSLGAVALIQFLGLISLNLVVINLIPFPALDGGRLLTIGVEKLIGRRVNAKVEAAANVLGLLLLILLMIVVTIKDVANIL